MGSAETRSLMFAFAGHRLGVGYYNGEYGSIDKHQKGNIWTVKGCDRVRVLADGWES